MPFVYSPDYFADIGNHVFPVIKYFQVFEKLTREGNLTESEVTAPRFATDEEMKLIHTEEYLQDLKLCRLTDRTGFSELPLSKEIIDMFVLVAGGTIVACEQALEGNWCVHLSGGFHHAFCDKAEGFCYLNDLAIAARAIQQSSKAERIAIVDCDLHQGNGTARIFQGDESVFTFSIHQRDLYPLKQESDLDIHLPMHVADDEYLDHLQKALTWIFEKFQPDLVIYQAGADPFINDQLGDLALTISGLRRRDKLVFQNCRSARCPVAVTLGGGYAYNTSDTVQIHFNTCEVAGQVLVP